MIKLDDAFWDRFVAEHWRKQPVVFNDVQDLIDNPLLRPDEIISGLTNVAQEALSQANNIRAMENVRLYLGRRLAQPPEYMPFFPQTTSFDEYCEQVSAKVGGEEFGVVLNFFHLMYPPFWDRVRKLSAPLVQRLGLPASSIETAVFCGKYKSTAFGIHKDADADVMSTCPGRPKRFLAWPSEYFEKDPLLRLVATDPRVHRASAIELVLGPRDMMYMPRNWYHTAFNESDEPSASVAFGFWHRVSLPTLVGSMLRDFVERKLGDKAQFVGSWPNSSALPNELDEIVTMLSGDGLRHAIEASWRQRVADSGYGRAAGYL
jgi:hypothetical protein